MNLRDLKYLVEVASTRHFGRAAERCFVSQPTLSGQIKKLEEELGVTLFERTKRSVELTLLGGAIVLQARRVLEEADALRQLAESHQDPLVGTLRVGAIPTLSPYLMPLILRPLRKQCPQMKLVLSEELTDSLLTRLGDHEIDAALVATAVKNQEFESVPLFDEPFWLVHPNNHALAEKKNIAQVDLDGVDLLLLAEGHCLAEQAMKVCRLRDRGLQGDFADLRATSLETLLQMVGAGYGCTLLPALAMKTAAARDKGVKLRQLKLPDTHRQISLVFRRTFPRRKALEAFAAVVLKSLPASVCALDGL